MTSSDNQAVIMLSLSLSGGQGKTLTVLTTGLKASKLGVTTLLIDADPQQNLTDLLGVEILPNQPTLLEVIKGDVAIDDAIYPVPDRENLFLIPSDRALVNAQPYLMSVPNPARVLRKRLSPILSDFGLVIVDTPPQKSHICLTAIGAADTVVIPAEATAKGVGSLTETWAWLEECREDEAFRGELLGVLPFRARVVGLNLTGEASDNIAAMKEFIGDAKLLPAIVESVVYQRSWNYGKLPSEIDPSKVGLEETFNLLLQRLHRFIPSIPETEKQGVAV